MSSSLKTQLGMLNVIPFLDTQEWQPSCLLYFISHCRFWYTSNNTNLLEPGGRDWATVELFRVMSGAEVREAVWDDLRMTLAVKESGRTTCLDVGVQVMRDKVMFYPFQTTVECLYSMTGSWLIDVLLYLTCKTVWRSFGVFSLGLMMTFCSGVSSCLSRSSFC